jgi:hypothetical protein
MSETAESSYVVGGAKSSDKAPMFHKIPAHVLLRLAERYSLGAKHEDQQGRDWAVLGGEQNWQKGNAEYVTERYNHFMFHLNKWKGQYDSGVVDQDDNLSAALWGIALLMDAEKRGVISPLMGVRRAGETPSNHSLSE